MLCSACKGIWTAIQTFPPGSWNGPKPLLFDYPQLNDAWGGAHHLDPGAFLAAIEQKCYICSTIFRDFRPELRKQAFRFRFFYHLRLTQGDTTASPHLGDHYDLKFTMEVLDGQAPIAKEQVIECGGIFKILPATEITTTGEPPGLTGDTFSTQCKAQVQKWLDSCTSSHGLCNQNWRKSDFPSRLLKIEAKGLFRLEHFGNNARYPPYVTLSHCWEVDMPLKLSTETVDNLSQGLPVVNLPRRFQDAMSIALWMDINYIWIDALCIFQDSEVDWTAESTRMGDIYTNSYCNIAATGAGPDRGCFTRRYTPMVEPYTIPNPRSQSPLLTHVLGYNDFWSNSLLDARLHNRGWVLQERLLSPRTIHFGQEQIFWECRCQLACEAYPQGIPQQFRNWKTKAWRQSDIALTPHIQQPGFWRVMTTHILRLLGKELKENWSEVYSVWSNTVERYMECGLSYSEDKLVAISGMAQKIAAITKQRYLAGLWEDSSLPQSLLWYVLGRRQADTTASYRIALAGQQKYRAPSWSWASLEAKVIWNWPVSCDKVLVKIIDTDIQEVKAGNLGRIMSASMRVTGFLFKATIKIMNNGAEGILEEDGRYTLTIYPECGTSTASSIDSARQMDIEPIIYLDTPLLPQSFADIWMLPVCSGWRGRSGNVPVEMAGLLLHKLPSTMSNNVFMRLGIFGLDKTQTDLVCGSFADQGVSFEKLLVERVMTTMTIE